MKRIDLHPAGIGAVQNTGAVTRDAPNTTVLAVSDEAQTDKRRAGDLWKRFSRPLVHLLKGNDP